VTAKSTWALRRQPALLKLAAGQGISAFGSQITLLALPLTAVVALGASPIEMGILGAAQLSPFLLLGLFVGAWVDRTRRRPIVIAADLGRALLLASIPLAMLLGAGSVAYLCVVAFLTSCLSVLAGTAYQSYLPSLVPRERLVEANGSLEASRSLARVAGPSLGGGLVQLVTAPLAILFDALSFLASALLLWSIRTPEPAPTPRPHNASLRGEIAEGLCRVLSNQILRTVAIGTAIGAFFDSILVAVFMLHLTHELALQPTTIGILFATGGGGAVLGASLVGRITKRLDLGNTIALAAVALGLGYAAIPLAAALPTASVALLLLAAGLTGFGGTLYNVSLLSLRQGAAPDHLLGRVNGTMQFLVWGAMPIGALLGGTLAGLVGLRETVTIVALGVQVAVAWILLSPIRTVREPAPHLHAAH